MRRLLFCIPALLAVQFSLAQIEFAAGLSAGALTSQVHGDGYEGYYRMAPTGGAFVTMGFSEKIGTKLEFLFTPKGSRNKPNTEAGDFNTFKLGLNYITIPVSIQYKLRPEFHLEGGLYYGILISQKQEFNGIETPVTPPYNDGDLGGQIGATYYMSDKLALHIRQDLSLTPMRSAPDGAPPGVGWDGGGYNRALYFMFIYQLN